MSIPLGGSSGTQCLSRLAAVCEPSIYPAWRRFASPVFIPLGGNLRAHVYPAWRWFVSPVFVPPGGHFRPTDEHPHPGPPPQAGEGIQVLGRR
ncbi:hypothetical protein HMPREF9080_01072 [Cardiobacterium valvarum F0432]|uniref:Uncharacterized protein n=1 Tax=Cardiobacterium valvarum F0432 TaxID=797473 RepID=G9ZEC0_9GAMM|nr:hypothetical protein HMPREF9080_01072 [Cardiobacterium valvarum F0432]